MPSDGVHATLVDDLIRRRGVVMLIGAPDTGKTTFARRLLREAVAAGRTAAYVDADVDQSTTGPPACVGLHYCSEQGDVADLQRADAVQFVGSITPEGVVLQQVVATAALVNLARDQVDLVVVDTTGVVSGVIGQTLKYHKMELCRPDVVIGLQRGAELDPLVGVLRRFFSADVEVAPIDPDVHPPSPDERSAARTRAFAAAFAEPLQRWRVRPTVFAPTLPAGLDLQRLDGVLVGLQDGSGWCLGLGVLEYDGDALVVITNAGEEMRGLRLGSLAFDSKTFAVHRLRLRDLMFGLD
ncbi:MAG: AAA family ATPase [Actinobacteria bacterium]|nr:AAA family ATPase [Actinomycetota bacterium]